MDKCNRCKKFKDTSEFIIQSGKSTRCVKCRKDRNEQAKKYYKKRSTLSDKEKNYFKRRNRNASLKRKYNIDIETYEQMLKEQDNLCGICEQSLITNSQKGWGGKREACVDHNHKSGKVRGILCRGCNLALSMIENKIFQQKSNQYLSKFEK